MTVSSLSYRSLVAGASAITMLFAIASPASAHHGKRSLSGKGTMTISDQTTCGPNDCYAVNLDFPASGNQDISATATGEGMTDQSTCKNKSGGSCCVTAITLSFTFDRGGNPAAGIDCTFAGNECDKPASSPTSATFKGKLECIDGTGELMGRTASGKLSAKVSTSTGEGPASASLHFK
jgi:hypothetical protein